MFRIRASQLDRFGALALGEFETRMVRYFSETFPNETARLDLPRWVDENVRDALDRRIELEPVVAQYLLLKLRLGANVAEEHPWFETTLRRKDLTPDGKMRVLVRTLNDIGLADVDRFVMKNFV